jgi:hypothetical protein
MQFKIASIFTTALAVASSANALQVDVVVSNIEKVTDLSSDANDILMSVSNPLNIFTAVPVSLLPNTKHPITPT